MGEVAPSYGDGGVMGNATELMTHDPSVRFADTSPASLGRNGYFSFSPLPG